ncbi:MAG: acetate/propionate family kinase [Gammaproteobacteria bacterium]|nr:acetate/propionate family kinase [Gammaproteobacteria bacterium]
MSAMQTILIINSGSSSIKFALFSSKESLVHVLEGKIEGIGFLQGSFTIKSLEEKNNLSRSLVIADHKVATSLLMDWIQLRIEPDTLIAVGHRVVHGGQKYDQAQRITSELIEELHQLSSLAPEHLPHEIALIEAFNYQFPDLAQVACFDTAFHHEMPRVAKLFPIPRRYEKQGIYRYGFHGLSCAYVMQELEGLGTAKGRVILAHLGNGASMTAILDGRSVDTSMGLTPAAGLMMSTRSGDIDPGLAAFLVGNEQMTASQYDHMINHESGLLGISEISADMNELLAQEKQDMRAAEAIALFCYHAKKMLGAYMAVLGGLDTLVFTGGIGENASRIRTRICDGLKFFGIELNESLNALNAHVISTNDSRVTVRVIKTNEELMIAQSVCRVLDIGI